MKLKSLIEVLSTNLPIKINDRSGATIFIGSDYQLLSQLTNCIIGNTSKQFGDYAIFQVISVKDEIIIILK